MAYLLQANDRALSFTVYDGKTRLIWTDSLAEAHIISMLIMEKKGHLHPLIQQTTNGMRYYADDSKPGEKAVIELDAWDRPAYDNTARQLSYDGK